MKIRNSVATDLEPCPESATVSNSTAAEDRSSRNPVCDDESTYDGPHRVRPAPAEEAPSQKRHDGKQRRHGIGEHVQVRGAQIVIVIRVLVFVRMTMVGLVV